MAWLVFYKHIRHECCWFGKLANSRLLIVNTSLTPELDTRTHTHTPTIEIQSPRYWYVCVYQFQITRSVSYELVLIVWFSGHTTASGICHDTNMQNDARHAHT